MPEQNFVELLRGVTAQASSKVVEGLATTNGWCHQQPRQCSYRTHPSHWRFGTERCEDRQKTLQVATHFLSYLVLDLSALSPPL